MEEHDQHVSPIKSPKQLVIIVALAFVVPITLIVLLSQLVTSGEKGAGASEAAVLARIKPVGDVTMAGATGGAAPATAAAAAAPVVVATATPAAGAKPDGKKVFDTVCTVCHATGLAGAPKFGDKAAWAPRLKTGVNTLYASALNGKGAMPAKGGNAALSDADVKAAVDYMAAAGR
jgi:cytochrome c5